MLSISLTIVSICEYWGGQERQRAVRGERFLMGVIKDGGVINKLEFKNVIGIVQIIES